MLINDYSQFTEEGLHNAILLMDAFFKNKLKYPRQFRDVNVKIVVDSVSKEAFFVNEFDQMIGLHEGYLERYYVCRECGFESYASHLSFCECCERCENCCNEDDVCVKAL